MEFIPHELPSLTLSKTSFSTSATSFPRFPTFSLHTFHFHSLSCTMYMCTQIHDLFYIYRIQIHSSFDIFPSRACSTYVVCMCIHRYQHKIYLKHILLMYTSEALWKHLQIFLFLWKSPRAKFIHFHLPLHSSAAMQIYNIQRVEFNAQLYA